MLSRTIVGAVLASLLILAGCSTFPHSAAQAPPPAPASPMETVPPQPGPTYVWVPGAYTWQPATRAYVWVPGHWTVPPKGLRLGSGSLADAGERQRVGRRRVARQLTGKG